MDDFAPFAVFILPPSPNISIQTALHHLPIAGTINTMSIRQVTQRSAIPSSGTRSPRKSLLRLLQLYSYKKGIVTLASGKKSDFFIDCKETLLLSEAHWLVGNLLLDELFAWIGPRNFDYVAGVELGGCSLASAVSTVAYGRYNAKKSKPSIKDDGSLDTKAGAPARYYDAVYVRKTPKDHGKVKLVEGAANAKRGSRVVLLEDVVTTGGSSQSAMSKLRDEGFKVVGVLALVDRLEGGRDTFAEIAMPYRSIYTKRDFVSEK